MDDLQRRIKTMEEFVYQEASTYFRTQIIMENQIIIMKALDKLLTPTTPEEQ